MLPTKNSSGRFLFWQTIGMLQFCLVAVCSSPLWRARIGQNWRDVISFIFCFHCQVWQISKAKDISSNMLLDKHLPGETPFNTCKVWDAVSEHVELPQPPCDKLDPWASLCLWRRVTLPVRSKCWICSLCSGWWKGVPSPVHLLSCRASQGI